MKDNKVVLVSVGVITMMITKMILSSIGVYVLSTVFIVMLVMTSSIIYTVYANVHGRNFLFGIKLNVVTSISMVFTSFSMSVSIVIIQCFPKYSDEHPILTLIVIVISLLSFFSCMIVWIVVSKIVTNKKRY